MPWAVAILHVDPTQSSGTGTARGLPRDRSTREDQGQWRQASRRCSRGTPGPIAVVTVLPPPSNLPSPPPRRQILYPIGCSVRYVHVCQLKEHVWIVPQLVCTLQQYVWYEHGHGTAVGP